MRILVCGGRDFADRPLLFRSLDRIHAKTRVSCVIHGDAPGADRMARDWAKANRVVCRPFPAKWDQHGRAAGPIRNQQMLDEACPDLVVAFPGGRGTADMTKRAVARMVDVLEIGPMAGSRTGP